METTNGWSGELKNAKEEMKVESDHDDEKVWSREEGKLIPRVNEARMRRERREKERVTKGKNVGLVGLVVSSSSILLLVLIGAPVVSAATRISDCGAALGAVLVVASSATAH